MMDAVPHGADALLVVIAGSSRNASITRNTFDDLSGGAVKLGNVDDARAVSNASADWDAGFALSDNTMSNAALEYRGAPVVFAGCVFVIKIGCSLFVCIITTATYCGDNNKKNKNTTPAPHTTTHHHTPIIGSNDRSV